MIQAGLSPIPFVINHNTHQLEYGTTIFTLETNLLG
ncbi:MAG: hypothetical protein FD169_2499 [Bacillota bacterium]|nr:MAG: hypothetical protein FD169_2499 [Bacillota bacterium]